MTNHRKKPEYMSKESINADASLQGSGVTEWFDEYENKSESKCFALHNHQISTVFPRRFMFLSFVTHMKVNEGALSVFSRENLGNNLNVSVINRYYWLP